MVKLNKSRLTIQLFFALLLTVVQVQLLNHQADLEAHSGESSCEICIHFSQVGHAALGQIEVVAATAVEKALVATVPESVAAIPPYGLPQSRAPPSSSLI